MTTSMPHVAAAALLAATATAQSFSYPNFANVAPLNLLGNAVQSGTALRLTANTSNQTGWAWHRTAMPVIAGFDTTFSFRITPPVGGTKAEGMALVIHDDSNGIATTGGTVWGMGYGNGSNGAVGIRNSIAIELDTFQDGFLSDSSSNELTIHTRGSTGNHENEQYSIARATPTAVLSDGNAHSLRVRYTPGLIEVFVDGATTPAISRVYSLVTGGTYANGSIAPAPTLANGTALAGFCATTGAGTLTEQVEILSWTWTSTPLRDPCYAGTLGENLLTVNGSSGGPLRTLDLATWQPFTIAMQSPTVAGPGMPWAMAASFAPSPGAPGTALPFGNMCMQVAPFGPNELVLADAFGAFSPIVVVGPAPHTIAVPAGVLTFPLDVTLQSVIATSASLASFGISNAIDLRFRPSAPPTITTVVPLSAIVGQPITVTGQRLLSGCTVAVNGAPITPTSRTDTQIVFPYPAGVPCGSTLTVTLLDGQAVSSPFNPTPAVTSTALNSGPAAGNQLFVITGTGFSTGTTVTIGGAAATIQSVSSTAIVVFTPAGTPGPAPVVVTTPGGCTATTTYTYL